MKITFANKKLEKLANDDRKMQTALGKSRARLLRRRLTQLEDANILEDVRYLPGNFHELIANRKGQWACDLDQPYRLIFTPHENPIPTDASNRTIWLAITGVEVIEIINYHNEN